MPTTPKNERAFDPNASIVLVGCRGAGKRSLGFMGATHLRRTLVTEDHYFKNITDMSRGKFLQAYGREIFSQKVMEVFKHMLDSNRTGCIIVCGMTSLVEEAQDALRAYMNTNPVVYVRREKEQMALLLDPADAEQLLKADESHRQCSNLEYFNLLDDATGTNNYLNGNHVSSGTSTPSVDGRHSAPSAPSKLLAARDDFNRFLDFVTGRGPMNAWLESPFSINAIPPEFRAYSYALRVRLSAVMNMDMAWEDFEARGDCIEFIIDTWPDDLLAVVARQVALIRRKLGVPIIYHVEENPRKERRRSPEESYRMDSELYDLGLRLGVDYISVDLQRDRLLAWRVLKHKGRSKVIGNFWYLGLGALPWDDDEQVNNFNAAKDLGCDMVRMVRFCTGNSPAEDVEAFKRKIQTVVPNPKPLLVAYEFSVLGVRTPLQARVFAPVKHPDMPNDRDHLATVCSYSSAFEALFRNFMLDPLHFYVLGANVGYSLSPAMHTAAYSFFGMPHTFHAVTCSTLEDLNRFCVGVSFGGACLTAPFKVAVLPHLKTISYHAAAIGAVNVVLPLRGEIVKAAESSSGRSSDGNSSSSSNEPNMLDHANARNKAGPAKSFYGDNTDWSSILTCLRRAISPRNHVQPSLRTGLVIGAGGMARAAIYALIQLGCRRIFVYNRTRANAEAVADHFNEWARVQGMTAPGAKARSGAGSVGDGDWAEDDNIVRVLDDLTQPWPMEYQPPTMVISCVPANSVDGDPPADFEMPVQWLKSPTGGVVMELAYEPLVTPLVAQMQTLRDTSMIAASWVVVDGLEIVGEMAIEAFELLTGRMAPKRLMRDVCRRTWEQQQQGQ